MANLTITVDEDTLKRARIRAIQRGESVNQILAEQLRRYAGIDQEAIDRQREVTENLIRLSKDAPGGSGGRRWSRDDLYAERLDRYPER